MNLENYTLTLTYDELLIVHSSLNEVCHALPKEDFENRIGRPVSEAVTLLDRVIELRNEAGQ